MADETLERIASLHNTHADFDGVLAHYTGQIVTPLVHQRTVLECGCSTGVITEMIVGEVKELDVVEGSQIYADKVEERFHGQLRMFVSLFDEFEADKKYDIILFLGVLHHLETPAKTLKHLSRFLKDDGELLISVPNMTSLHRRLGVAMGVVEDVYATSERNTFFEQFGRFDKQRLEAVVQESGLTIKESFGFFLKPFPHSVMQDLELKQDVLDGLFQLGKEHSDLACQLFLRAQA